jgi:hypothetical protein
MGDAKVAIWSEPDPAFWASAFVLARAASKLSRRRLDLWDIRNFTMISSDDQMWARSTKGKDQDNLLGTVRD